MRSPERLVSKSIAKELKSLAFSKNSANPEKAIKNHLVVGGHCNWLKIENHRIKVNQNFLHLEKLLLAAMKIEICYAPPFISAF